MDRTKKWMLNYVLALIIASSCVLSIPKHLLYPHGHGMDHFLPQNYDISSPEIPLKVPIIFYNEEYRTIFVNINGILSFRTDIPSFINIQFPLDYPIIAPLYTNVDTRSSGFVSYRETQDPEILSRATQNVLDSFSYANEFRATSVFICTWSEVGYFRNGSDKTNTYQVVIINNGTDSYVEFIYPLNGIQWIQGSGSDSGLPDARAQAGFVSEDGRQFTLRGSGTDQIMNAVKLTNMNLPGQWIFHVGNIGAENIKEPDQYKSVTPEQFITSCAEGSSICHSKATCVNMVHGFCCICKTGYYGNGKTCLRNDVPLRVSGKVNGQINGEILSQLDLQSYVVMSDGRAYTAISKIPLSIGYEIQTLNIIGAVIGWLFAKPVGEVKNGYQLTGGIFNHTANVVFMNTGEKVTIWNRYHGLNVFDQLRLETEIVGNIPKFPPEAKIVMPEYVEEYTITTKGLIQSQKVHYITFGDSEEQIPISIDQSFTYTPCDFEEPMNSTTFKVKVFRNFISYESKEQIIRYGLSGKVTPLTEEDPCIAGSSTCGKNSYCLVEGDSFRCACHPGYQQIYERENTLCVDINECTTGSHYCDMNAQCINEEGSFSCKCNEGYEGDGRRCEPLIQCGHSCDSNAECVQIDNRDICQCLPGFAGDGITCTRIQVQGCNVSNYCSPYALCMIVEEEMYDCVCLPGYSGDGRLCEYIEDGETTTTSINEETTFREYHYRVNKQCHLDQCRCPDGYIPEYDTDYCILQNDETNYDDEKLSCNIVNNCHPYAQCVFISNENKYQCQCNAGFEGDGYECSETYISCVEVDICDVHATCTYDDSLGKSRCVCNHGYQGDGTFCSPIAECSSHEDCDENSYCSNAFHNRRYECVCHDGYVKNEENKCISLVSNCGGVRCDINAQCFYENNDHSYYCRCNSGYVGNGSLCKRLPLGCNVQNNCGLHAQCEFDVNTSSYECKCLNGYSGDGYICTSKKTCDVDRYLCDQHASCILDYNQNYVCQCNVGYVGNGTMCKISPKYEGNFLLLNQGMATLRVPFNPSDRNPGRPIQIQKYQTAIAIDIDCYEGRVYWSDIADHVIKSSNYDGTLGSDFLTEDIGSPEGISIDWISRNIYWTDSNKDTIEVANLDTKLRKVLFSEELVNPRGISVHPQRGKIFWSDWNRLSPKLEWANMDGTGREIFLQGENVKLPNSLAIDWATDHLCFADAGTKKIECIDIDTRQIYTIAANCTYPFGLAISNNHFYWTDWISKKIESVDKATLSQQKMLNVPLGGSGNKLYGITVVPESCLAIKNKCQFENGKCPSGHLCLLNGYGDRTCVCATNDNICNNST